MYRLFALVRFHFGRLFLSQNAVEVFYGLIFAMILDYYVHCDICVKCCRQVKMDSSVESDLRNGFSGGGLLLGRKRIALAIWNKSHEG